VWGITTRRPTSFVPTSGVTGHDDFLIHWPIPRHPAWLKQLVWPIRGSRLWSTKYTYCGTVKWMMNDTGWNEPAETKDMKEYKYNSQSLFDQKMVSRSYAEKWSLWSFEPALDHCLSALRRAGLLNWEQLHCKQWCYLTVTRPGILRFLSHRIPLNCDRGSIVL